MAQWRNTHLASTGPGFHSSLSPTKAHSIPAQGGQSDQPLARFTYTCPLIFSTVGCLSGYHRLPSGYPCQNPQWLLSQGTPLTWQPRATGWPGTSRLFCVCIYMYVCNVYVWAHMPWHRCGGHRYLCGVGSLPVPIYGC